MTASALLLCAVIGVSDGDTLTVRCGERAPQKVRLAEIDTPERKQAFGTRARQALSAFVHGKQIQLRLVEKDRYGRSVGQIYLDDRYINFEMVRAGMAWCHPKYVIDRACFELERAARAGREGLWRDPAPEAPWEWRSRQRTQRR